MKKPTRKTATPAQRPAVAHRDAKPALSDFTIGEVEAYRLGAREGAKVAREASPHPASPNVTLDAVMAKFEDARGRVERARVELEGDGDGNLRAIFYASLFDLWDMARRPDGSGAASADDLAFYAFRSFRETTVDVDAALGHLMMIDCKPAKGAA